MKPSDTIYSVMVRVEDITGTPPILQLMLLNGKALHDYTPGTLADHGIGEHTTLHALHSVSGANRLRRKTLKALGITVAAADVEEEEEEEAGAPPVQVEEEEAADRMRMAVTDYMILGRARTITLEAEAGDTVASLMEQVQRRRRYPVALQRPICDGRPMRPDGGATLADYKVTRDSKLELDMNMGFAINRAKEQGGRCS